VPPICSSPENANVVRRHRRVCSYDRNPEISRLRDQQPIERIAVVAISRA
jgi:hypothetical protein